ncbi:hypothetical protein POM88_038026 [Heracleum sosnowskyi]|uniref:Xylanase inhibitor C-terminal domain-containing protein n=1 Tax=Heracleum sosnowskyi TaxID=360622 RepID=A0AAD8HR78_9APIA|nr:hypothetical protein POM88_038026 [Heracleum sosnowskyi]
MLFVVHLITFPIHMCSSRSPERSSNETKETSIYNNLVSAFTKAASLRKMENVASFASFGACFESSENVAKRQTGPVVPYKDIGLAGNKLWRFYGTNSMVSCLPIQWKYGTEGIQLLPCMHRPV